MSHDESVFLAFVLDSRRIKTAVCFLLAFWILAKTELLQIPNQLHFFTKIRDFLHARCKKSLIDVKNLPVYSRRN